jgi:hypothetical protein
MALDALVAVLVHMDGGGMYGLWRGAMIANATIESGRDKCHRWQPQWW